MSDTRYDLSKVHKLFWLGYQLCFGDALRDYEDHEVLPCNIYLVDDNGFAAYVGNECVHRLQPLTMMKIFTAGRYAVMHAFARRAARRVIAHCGQVETARPATLFPGP